MTRIFLIFILVYFSSCIGTKNTVNHEGNTKEFNLYSLLSNETYSFLSKDDQLNFKDSLYSYLRNCEEYNFNNGRSESIICFPILLNQKNDKAIVPILKRMKDLEGKKLEIVVYVSAKLNSKIWEFKVKKGFSESFSYTNDSSILNEVEIGVKTVRNLLLRNEIDGDKIYNDKIFDGILYVF